jgi:hypothetical protein
MGFLIKNWPYIIFFIALVLVSLRISKVLGPGKASGGCCGGYMPEDTVNKKNDKFK